MDIFQVHVIFFINQVVRSYNLLSNQINIMHNYLKTLTCSFVVEIISGINKYVRIPYQNSNLKLA